MTEFPRGIKGLTILLWLFRAHGFRAIKLVIYRLPSGRLRAGFFVVLQQLVDVRAQSTFLPMEQHIVSSPFCFWSMIVGESS